MATRIIRKPQNIYGQLKQNIINYLLGIFEEWEIFIKSRLRPREIVLEVKEDKMENTQNLKSLHWDITNKCNLRCNHCYNANKYFDEESSEYINANLTLNEAKEIVDKFYSKGFRHIHLWGESLWQLKTCLK